jgi:hypothetical protein
MHHAVKPAGARALINYTRAVLTTTATDVCVFSFQFQSIYYQRYTHQKLSCIFVFLFKGLVDVTLFSFMFWKLNDQLSKIPLLRVLPPTQWTTSYVSFVWNYQCTPKAEWTRSTLCSTV